jgi:hypothetical protein
MQIKLDLNCTEKYCTESCTSEEAFPDKALYNWDEEHSCSKLRQWGFNKLICELFIDAGKLVKEERRVFRCQECLDRTLKVPVCEPLGEEFEKVLYDNLDSLYEE